MEMEITRPALGQIASLGTLYDARYDCFLPFSLFGNEDQVGSSIKIAPTTSINYEYRTSEKSSDKLGHVDISAGLRASFLAGMVKVDGSGKYLNDTGNNHKELTASMQCDFRTQHEKITLNDPNVKSCIQSDALKKCGATHVVTGIQYGAQTFVTARYKLSKEKDKSTIQGKFESTLRKLSLDLRGQASGDISDDMDKMEESFQISIHADIRPLNNAPLPTDFQSTKKFIDDLSQGIGTPKYGKGVPVVFTLSPLATVGRLIEMKIRVDSTIQEMNAGLLNEYTSIFDDIQKTIDDWTEYDKSINDSKVYISKDHQAETRSFLNTIKSKKEDFQSEYREALEKFRNDNNIEYLKSLPARIRQDMEPFTRQIKTKYQDKMDFCNAVIDAGGIYTQYKGLETTRKLAGLQMVDVLYFDGKKETIMQYSSRLGQLLGDSDESRPVWVVDCEGTEEEVRMVRFRQGAVIKPNVLQEQELLATKYVMRYDPGMLDRNVTRRPAARRPVRIPCPTCDQTVVGEWLCLDCEAPVEYGFSDTFMYCRCGQIPRDAYRFHCPIQTHGAFSTTYEPGLFNERLEGLKAFAEKNILLLGETGVGKSTFINAFANYVCYTTLEEASRNSFQYVIPYSFQARDYKTKQKEDIRVEMNSDEHDASHDGQSATQRTVAYCFRFKDTLVRLIDTPGIGDTRGRAQDEANLRDVLSVLGALKNIHGILFLVNGTATRLTDRFSYCIETLLGELDSDAANLMVFGFTHTSDPNRAFSAQALVAQKLRELPHSPFADLGDHQVYTFESESFKYLAARREGIEMGKMSSFQDGWDHSQEECKRLLQNIHEGPVWNMETRASVGYCRRVMEQISQPVIDIANLILDNIDNTTTATDELTKVRKDGQSLELKRYFTQTVYREPDFPGPYVVCGHPSCFQKRNIDDSTLEEKRVCCYDCQVPKWNNILFGLPGAPGLEKCDRFRGKWLGLTFEVKPCRTCRHSTEDHRLTSIHHIIERKKMVDKKVEAQLDKNSLDIEEKQQIIQDLKNTGAEYANELSEILKFAASLSVFLRRRALALYEDPLHGRLNTADPNKMQEISNRYNQALEAQNTDSGSTMDSATVREKLDTLYNLKHFGSSLRVVVSAFQATQDGMHLDQVFPVTVSGWEPPAGGGDLVPETSEGRGVDAASQLGGGLPIIIPVVGHLAQ